MKLGKQKLPLSFLIRRGWMDTECRVMMNESKVKQYAEEMANGDGFPSPVVFVDQDEVFRVGDGFHRISAAKFNGKPSMEVEVRKGGKREAILHGIETNRQQKGLPLTQGDKEKCILLLLQDEEACKWTQTRIAEIVGSSHAYVSQVVSKFKDVVTRPDMIVDKNGIVRSKSAPKDKEHVNDRKQKTMIMFAQGVPKIEISRRLKIARWAVQRYIYDAQHEKKLTKCPHCNGSGYTNGSS